jgi:hypothetical protein
MLENAGKHIRVTPQGFRNPITITQDRKEPPRPILPDKWECTALLHPYSPPPDNDRQTAPFFQLCIASISYLKDDVLSIQVQGLEYGTWWYKITPQRTTLSFDQGTTWDSIDTGWTLPTTQWLTSNSCFFATGHLNWMRAQEVDWWKTSLPHSRAATWIWFDHITGFPFRMMFGCPPPSPTRGRPEQLAFFQNYSFTYFSSFEAVHDPNVNVWATPIIQELKSGNPDDWQLPVWENCFSMRTIMTPVDSNSFPLPATVFYQWKPDNAYHDTTDRCQATVMSYEYNPGAGCNTEVALLFGIAPRGIDPPPHAGSGYIYRETDSPILHHHKKIISCRNIGLGQQPPYWARIPAIEGLIHASVSDHKALCPGRNVNIISVLFPPISGYPQGRYLWTWYSAFPGSDGTASRPVWFGESASNIREGGTCLALADYFEYNIPQTWFSGELFKLPDMCTKGKNSPLKRKAPVGWLSCGIRQKANFTTQIVNTFCTVFGCFGTPIRHSSESTLM